VNEDLERREHNFELLITELVQFKDLDVAECRNIYKKYKFTQSCLPFANKIVILELVDSKLLKVFDEGLFDGKDNIEVVELIKVSSKNNQLPKLSDLEDEIINFFGLCTIYFKDNTYYVHFRLNSLVTQIFAKGERKGFTFEGNKYAFRKTGKLRCSYFRSKKECYKGEFCPLLHLSDEHTFYPKEEKKEKKENEGKKKEEKIKEETYYENTDFKKKKCAFNMKGKCKNGKNCKFSHS
jgi:hypothetical protein